MVDSFLNHIMGLDSSSGDENFEAAIQSHISLLLNTRRGSLFHLPTYGLPDLSEIYQSRKGDMDNFAEEIRETLSRFEPRLRNVEVKGVLLTEDLDGSGNRLTFNISGQIKQGVKISNLSFRTVVFRDGRYNTSKVNQYG